LLSYRHAFHAGNFADVLKHSTLTLVLEYFTEKQKGFSYIDSHSGAGMYQLSDKHAQKTGEYKDGIAKIIDRNNMPPALLPYIELVKNINQQEALNLYPGSPGIAKDILRRQDAAHLFELHPADTELLTDFCQRWRKAQVNQSDGYKGVLGQLPPPTRRGVVLIDPPYELKEDYVKAVNTIISGYKKFSTGCYILWYPVVHRHYIDTMETQFKQSQVRNLLKVEYQQQNDTEEYGMTGTGLFIVNPPWKLNNQLNEVLPFIKQFMGESQSSYSINQLIEE
jgi:23S rRNA (adenine2030-N6)-methyltransferase